MYLDFTQQPRNVTVCEGSNAVLSCVVFDGSPNNAADNTVWALANPLTTLPSDIVNNTRDGDVVTSVLTIEDVSLNDNGNGYLCVPALDDISDVGVISVAGREYTYVCAYSIFCCKIWIGSYIHRLAKCIYMQKQMSKAFYYSHNMFISPFMNVMYVQDDDLEPYQLVWLV